LGHDGDCEQPHGQIGDLLAYMFLVGTELFVVSPLLPLIVADFQSSPALAGLSVAVFALTYVIGAPLLASSPIALDDGAY